MLIVAAAFGSNVLWLCALEFSDSPELQSWAEMLFLLCATISLANCARFGSLLSLVEFEPRKKENTIWKRMGSMGSSMSLRSLSTESWSEDEAAEWKVGHEEWDGKVEDLAHRGITLKALLDFYSQLRQTMPHFDPAQHKTADVVRQAIIPMSQEQSCSLTEILMDKSVLPDRMVTHSWSNQFACLIACVVADALELPSYAPCLSRLEGDEMEALKSELYWKGKLNTAYWICCFCINQHAGICGFVPSYMQDPVTGVVPAACTCQHPKYWSDTDPCRDGWLGLKRVCLGSGYRCDHLIKSGVFSGFERVCRASCLQSVRM